MGKIGIQLYSVRQAASKNFLQTVRNIADMGYEGIQFAGFFDTPSSELKKVMDEKKIAAAGAHIPFHMLEDKQLAQTLQYNEEIGNFFIICPVLPEGYRSADGYKRAAERFNRIGEICKKEGFTFGYHNHHFEFERFHDTTGFELLFENTDPDLVKMELDCFWVTYAGLIPEDLMEKYQNRIVSLHVKDMTVKEGKKISTELGNGTLDIKGMLEIGDKFGVEWFTVEQEHYDQDPMVSAKINADYLIKLLDR